MRLSSVVLLAVALMLGLGAVVLTMNFLEQQRGAPQVAAPAPAARMRKLVVAEQPLRFGTELTSINLKEIDWPAGPAPDGSFASVGEVVKSNERRVALGSIERGEPVLAAKITGPGQRATLSAVFGKDKKAVTIRVTDVSGTAGFVLPGDRVDVLMTRSEDNNRYTDVLLQNIRTLAIDQLADERSDKPSVAKAVTLEVTTSDAQKLALGELVGRLSLVLRQAGATTSTPARRISIADLGEGEPAQVQTVVAAATEPAPAVVPARRHVVGITRPVKGGGFKREEAEIRRGGSVRQIDNSATVETATGG